MKRSRLGHGPNTRLVLERLEDRTLLNAQMSAAGLIVPVQPYADTNTLLVRYRGAAGDSGPIEVHVASGKTMAAKFLQTMKDYPPSQTPGSFNLSKIEEQLKSAGGE